MKCPILDTYVTLAKISENVSFNAILENDVSEAVTHKRLRILAEETFATFLVEFESDEIFSNPHRSFIDKSCLFYSKWSLRKHRSRELSAEHRVALYCTGTVVGSFLNICAMFSSADLRGGVIDTPEFAYTSMTIGAASLASLCSVPARLKVFEKLSQARKEET